MTTATHRRTVWFVNQYAGSPAHGMEFRHFELGRQLVALGWEVVIVSGSYSHLFATRPAVGGEYTFQDIEGLRYCWVKVPAYRGAASVGRVINMITFMVRLYRLPTGGLPPPDAIVVSSPSLFPVLPAERWARRFGARLLFEVRDVWPLTLQELGGLPPYHPLVVMMGLFERRAYRVAEAVISVLPAALPHLVDRGMAPEKFRYVPNGVLPYSLREPSVEVPARISEALRPSTFTVGFVGTLGTANALEPLLDAARRLVDDDVRFVIAGKGPDEASLRARSVDLANVAFVGPIAKDEVPATLEKFDACYVGFRRRPLYRFGISPNKLFDYMAAGRPVILAAEAADDPVREAGCGLTVPPEDPAALAQAIRKLRDMTPAERARLGRNGRAAVERHYAYPVLARRYAAILGSSG